MARNKPEKQLFGSIMLVSAKCPKCKEDGFIVDGKHTCCNIDFEPPDQMSSKRMVQTASKRHHIPKKIRDAVLEQQDHCCIYCSRPLWGYEENKATGKRRKISTHFDHLIPWSYCGDDREHNIVASCARCNLHKSSNCFRTLDEAKIYIRQKREKDDWQ